VSALDQLLGGGMTRGVTVLGGGPGAGKTATACQAAAMMADMGRKVVYASYETGWDIVQLRCASAWSVVRPDVQEVSWSRIATGEERRSRPAYDGLTRAELGRYTVGSAMDPVARTLTAWDEGPGRNLAVLTSDNSVHDLCELCQQVCREDGRPPVLVVDYIQIVPTGATRQQDDYERVTEVMGALRTHAYHELGGNVLALSSLRKLSPQDRKDGPSLDWFRGSGHVGYDAEQAVILTVDTVKDEGGHQVPSTAANGATEGRMTIVKNRTGASGTSVATLLYGWCSVIA
jgi:replicative DNA helicase